MSDLTIRPATPADADILESLAVRLAAFSLPSWRAPRDISEADARAMREAVTGGSADNQVLMAERQGVAVGCLHVLVATDFFGVRHAHVSVLATAAAAEGTGVGRALMEYAEAWTVRRGLPLLTLNVFAQNDRARAFYERAGFEPEMVKYAKPIGRGADRDQSPV
jgi:ribosomal protein S18 acetylase RimI-like enzyme